MMKCDDMERPFKIIDKIESCLWSNKLASLTPKQSRDLLAWIESVEDELMMFRRGHSQWAVTSSGLETIDGHVRYDIPKERLLELRNGSDFYEWPLQMAEKNWVDIENFCDLFEFALQKHHRSSVDESRLQETIVEAIESNGRLFPWVGE